MFAVETNGCLSSLVQAPRRNACLWLGHSGRPRGATGSHLHGNQAQEGEIEQEQVQQLSPASFLQLLSSWYQAPAVCQALCLHWGCKGHRTQSCIQGAQGLGRRQ